MAVNKNTLDNCERIRIQQSMPTGPNNTGQAVLILPWEIVTIDGTQYIETAPPGIAPNGIMRRGRIVGTETFTFASPSIPVKNPVFQLGQV